MTARPSAGRRRLIAGLFAGIGVAVLLGLGIWQIERKAWKESLIATLEARVAARPAPLPPPASWAALDGGRFEFRRVSFSAVFLHDQEALVYAVGSALRPDVQGAGYWVLTPARLPDGSLVVVNRGFVPEGRQDPASRAPGQISGLVDIIGALRWPEAAGPFTPDSDPGRNLWFVRDPIAIARAKNWGAVAPFYIEQEAPAAPGGLPRAGRVVPALPNNHLQYAITWFALAAALIIIFTLWLRTSARDTARFGGGHSL